jgi:uncharacterized protein YbjT (DUF2867 family)
MILITAAAGQVGREAVADLVRRGAKVRALVRDVSRAVGPEGAESVQGSFEDDAPLARAFVGVDVLFLAGRDSPQAVAQHQRVLKHAREADVQHVVKLSALGALADLAGRPDAGAPRGRRGSPPRTVELQAPQAAPVHAKPAARPVESEDGDAFIENRWGV